MEQYYQGANGALYYHKTTLGTTVTNIPRNQDITTLTRITEEDYRRLLLAQEISKKTRLKEAVKQYHESQLSAAKQAYEELRALGMSDPTARALTKYHE